MTLGARRAERLCPPEPVMVHCAKETGGCAQKLELGRWNWNVLLGADQRVGDGVLGRWIDLVLSGSWRSGSTSVSRARAAGSMARSASGSGLRGKRGARGRKQPGERTGQSCLADLDLLEYRGSPGVSGAEDRGFDIELLPGALSVDSVAHEEASQEGRSPPRAGLRHRRGQRENPHRCQHTQHCFTFHDAPSLSVRFGSPAEVEWFACDALRRRMVTSCLALNAPVVAGQRVEEEPGHDGEECAGRQRDARHVNLTRASP